VDVKLQLMQPTHRGQHGTEVHTGQVCTVPTSLTAFIGTARCHHTIKFYQR